MRKRRELHWPNIHSRRISRHPNPSTTSPPFYSAEHGTSMISEKMIESWERSRLLYQSWPHFLRQPFLLRLLAWYVRKALMPSFVSLTFFPDIIPTCEGSTSWSWDIAQCTCYSLVHMKKLLRHPSKPGGKWCDIELRCTCRLAWIHRTLHQSSTIIYTTSSYSHNERGINQVKRGTNLHAHSSDWKAQ